MANFEKARALPPNWADDGLSDHINTAFGNTLASFVRLKPEYILCRRVDRAFYKIASNLNQPPHLIQANFLLRSHPSFRTGCQLAMGGQTVEAFPVLRFGLECALYALHTTGKPDLEDTWINRKSDDAALKACRREFQGWRIFNTLKECDPKLHSDIEGIYERTIEFGGHPNEAAIHGNMQIHREDDTLNFRQPYLTVDALHLRHAMKTAAQAGFGSLLIFRKIFSARFDLLGVSAELDRLGQQL